ncbi:MAG: Gfo/Idh/MocA family oxidoreductase, partial [Propionibacteriaceae bacterium]|nr:Gfo/Idh/MocA family oxidoreductase [Propionibacteriaceae bacterium]
GARPAVRVGFVGAGFSAHLQAEGLAKAAGPRVEWAAVAAGRRASAEQFAADFGVRRVYDAYEALLDDPDVDLVCVCVPSLLHAEVAVAAAQAGKHIVCEKPLTGAFGLPDGLAGAERAEREWAAARRDADQVRQAVQAAGVRFMYAENWVYAPAVAKIKRLLAVSGGSILDIRAEESHSGSHAAKTRRRAAAGGGALLTMGAHPIGAALHLKAFEAGLRGAGPVGVVSVVAETAALYDSAAWRRAGHGWLVSDWDDVETWANAALTFSDGSTAAVTASFAMLGGVKNTIEVYTTNAAYRGNMTPSDSLEVFTPDPAAFGGEYLHEKIESRTGWIDAAPDEDWIRGYPQEMQDFVAAVADGREPLSGLALAADVVDVVYAAYLSAAAGRRVYLAEVAGAA